MDRTWLGIGSLLMFVAVLAGAFGRHALKSRLSPEMLETFEIGTRWLVTHGLALVLLSAIAPRAGGAVTLAGVLFTVGSAIFTGSLYALVLTGVRGLGAVTPIGGLLLLAGWLALAWSAFASKGGAA